MPSFDTGEAPRRSTSSLEPKFNVAVCDVESNKGVGVTVNVHAMIDLVFLAAVAVRREVLGNGSGHPPVLDLVATVLRPVEVAFTSGRHRVVCQSMRCGSNNRFERSVMPRVPFARCRVYLLPLCQPRALGHHAAAQPHR